MKLNIMDIFRGMFSRNRKPLLSIVGEVVKTDTLPVFEALTDEQKQNIELAKEATRDVTVEHVIDTTPVPEVVEQKDAPVEVQVVEQTLEQKLDVLLVQYGDMQAQVKQLTEELAKAKDVYIQVTQEKKAVEEEKQNLENKLTLKSLPIEAGVKSTDTTITDGGYTQLTEYETWQSITNQQEKMAYFRKHKEAINMQGMQRR